MKTRHIILGIIVLILFLAGGLLAYVATQLQKDQIPLGAPNGELAFISDRNGNWDIFIIDSDGNLKNLTAGDAYQDYFPSFAFSSDMLNFLTSRNNDDLAPGQVTPDGEELKTLSIAQAVLEVFRAGRFDWDANFTPNGQQIVFASLRDLNLEIYVSDLHGENRTRLTHDGSNDWFPSVSPDGQTVLFLSDRVDGLQAVYSIDIDGENETRLTDNQWDNLRPVWSLEGDKILYLIDENNDLLNGVMHLYTMNPDGSNTQPFGEEEIFIGDPIYSTDFGQIVYMSNEEGNWNIYVMDADGSNVRRITEGDSNNMFPIWRPNPIVQDQ